MRLGKQPSAMIQPFELKELSLMSQHNKPPPYNPYRQLTLLRHYMHIARLLLLTPTNRRRRRVKLIRHPRSCKIIIIRMHIKQWGLLSINTTLSGTITRLLLGKRAPPPLAYMAIMPPRLHRDLSETLLNINRYNRMVGPKGI